MRYVCDSDFDCGREDPSDEMNCRLTTTTPRPATCIKGYYCPNTQSCLSQTQICDGEIDCPSSPDEKDCSVTKVANVASAKLHCINWFMNRRKKNTIHKWGHQLHRTAVALYLADENFFAVDNVTGHEIRYELTIRLLSKIKSRKSLRTEQLALYVHALLVSCLNPRHFYGHDLVSDLRRRVNFSKYASPLAILALCNAGAPMYQKDVDRLREIHTSRHKPYWTEVQVLATMALSCIASRNEYVRRGDLHTWINLAKKVPLHDGNETNRRTVALVIQMMLGTEYSTGFNWTAAVEVIKDPSFVSSSNFLDKYYLTPILNNKGLTAINNKHCGTFYNYESNMKMIVVRYTVWAKEGASLEKSWRIEISTSSTLYDVILKVQKLDSTHRVKFNVVDGKPYVKSVTGLDEDPETDYFWFTYERTVTKDLQLLEDSPVDIIVEDNDEFILWYRKGIWNDDGSGGSGEALVKKVIFP
ncbi:hypothetical protein JTE90_021361 [Oedothorax gibbosus]|uniref:Vitellogenin receptor n=1 Tax=Oedothorax gibbosus TaxID=931172 RepID=A0AAV6TWI9_9ARAC|nr:hypothetical protein JTE90_021361 [Oedothorax gibbosus]